MEIRQILTRVYVNHLDSTGTEISLSSIPPKTPLSYFHQHRKNEETYIFLKGEGEYQVDADCFPIKEGSVVRVAPNEKRCIYNSSDKPMVYIVIQSKENSLEAYSSDEGIRVEHEAKWTK